MEEVINLVKIYFFTWAIISFHSGDLLIDFFPNNKKSVIIITKTNFEIKLALLLKIADAQSSNGNVLRTSGFRSDWKKAIVILCDGHEIDILGGEI